MDSMQEAEKRMQKCPLAAPKINSNQVYQQQRRNKSLNARFVIENNLQSPYRNKKYLNGNGNELKKAESCGVIPADPGNSNAQTYPRIPISELQFTRISNQLVKYPNTRSSALLLQALRQVKIWGD
jgi:hypothetical protein